MTVLDDVSDLLRANTGRYLCDDCIARRLGLSVRQHANHKTRELAAQPWFERGRGICALCGGTRLVIAHAPG